MKKILITLTLFFSFLFAQNAIDIIKKVDKNMRGKSVYMKMKITIKSKRYTRNMVVENWSKGKKKSFVKILSPKKDRGITFLSRDGKMWQYIPRIERTIKIPPSMMLQNWMGSDISNDDLVKQSSMVDDYVGKVVAKKENLVTIELMPKEDATVVWGKIVTQIDTTHYTKVKDEFFDEDGKKVRVFKYAKVKQFGSYYIPTVWTIKPLLKKYNATTLVIENVVYDGKISKAYFKKSALKRFSR